MFKTGVQSLEFENGQYYVSIKNRTYFSRIPIPAKKVNIWKGLLK